MSLKPLRQLLGLDSTFKHINEVAKSPTLTRLPMIDGRMEREMKVNYSDDVTVAPRDLLTAGEEVSDGFEEASELGVH